MGVASRFLLISFVLLFSSPAFTDLAVRDDRILVKLSPEASRQAVALPEHGLPRGIPAFDRFLARHGIRDGHRLIRTHGVPVGDEELFRRTGLDRWYTLSLPLHARDRIHELGRELRREPWVEQVELVRVDRLLGVPNDPSFGQQWHHQNTGQTGGTVDADMDSTEAWDLGTGAPSGVVAFLDTGVEHAHEDLAGNITAGYDFVNDDADPEDDNGHGTSTSGLAVAIGNNGIGVAGVCWNCMVMQLKIADADGSVETDLIPVAIRWGADNGADAIGSMSAGWYRSQATMDAVEYALGLGTLVLCANGNATYKQGLALPTTPGVMGVGGSDHNDERLFSFGEHLAISAPGLDTYTTAIGNTYDQFGGTCGSVALASAIAALLRAEDGNLHVNELRHLLQLGADDQVGPPGEDAPGWDPYFGWGRVNVHGSLSLIDGPWLALDRPHYTCGGKLTVSLKDKAAGGSADVTLTGDLGGDSETVTVLPVTGDGYYEGSISISWAGKDGPVVGNDGKLDLADGETITAVAGGLSATAFLDCVKHVCFQPSLKRLISGDCDGDATADPGELWSIDFALTSTSSEMLGETAAVIETTDPNVELVDPVRFCELLNYGATYADDCLDGRPARFRVRAGAPEGHTIEFQVASISGLGWENDPNACLAEVGEPSFSIRANRDLGTELHRWDFDDGTPQGFSTTGAHGSGDLSECETMPTWQSDWGSFPATDRSHSGAYAMRLGDGTEYKDRVDGALTTPAFDVPAGGGALAFYTWMDTIYYIHSRRAIDGLVVEAKPTSGPTWSHLPEGTYTTQQAYGYCDPYFPVPFGWEEQVELLAGDGDGTERTGDAFDRRHQVTLDPLAGSSVQARFRFGSQAWDATVGTGVWIDTVTVHPWIADSWPGGAPANLQGSETSCPASYDLTWDPVSGAGGYKVYRSELSCQDATGRADVYDTASTNGYSDTGAVEDVAYYYAVEALEAGQGCPTERSCVEGGCICIEPLDPSNLYVDKSGDDLILTWDDPLLTGLTWNVYRDPDPDPSTWGGPHHSGVTDEDPGTPGIQHTDAGAVGADVLLCYLITATNECGESPLR
jgi:hypothetical protein